MDRPLSSPVLLPPRDQSSGTQACKTCRARKCKCDRRSPQCRRCNRLGKICQYDEPKLIKKDKTIEAILATLHSLNEKVDNMLLQSFSPIGRSFHAATIPYPPKASSTDQPAELHEHNIRMLPHSPKNQAAAAGTFPDVGTDSVVSYFGFLQHTMTGWDEPLSQLAAQEDNMLREPILGPTRYNI